MIGLERNADLVRMSCYAPLFGNANAWQWTPDLIWFDNLRVYGTPNYYVQRMFSLNRGDKVLSVQLNDLPEMEGQKKSLYVSSSLDEKEGYVIVKAVNITAETINATVELQGTGELSPNAKAIVLSSDKLTDENSLDNPKKVYPIESNLPISGSTFNYGFKPYSLTVLRVPLK